MQRLAVEKDDVKPLTREERSLLFHSRLPGTPGEVAATPNAKCLNRNTYGG